MIGNMGNSKINDLQSSMKIPVQTLLLGQSHCCTKPLGELKPIHLAQMKVPFVHEGHFLACRVLTESIVVVGL
jgi:hypothetical protein